MIKRISDMSLRYSRATFCFASVCLCILLAAGIVSAADNDKKTDEKKKPERDKNKLEEITFDDLKLEMAKDEEFEEEKLTDRVHELHEQLIRVRGWILPTFTAKGLTEFVLVRDNMECCFGPGAAIFDCIIVKMEDGKSTDYTTRPVTVDGVFEISKDFKDLDGKFFAIYSLKARRVK